MIDFNNALANLVLDNLYDTYFPAGSLLQIRSGAAPGAENAASGTLLAEITLPATPWAAAGAGSKAKQGTWSVAAVATGTAGHFRLRNAAGTRIEEGSITAAGGGGDATIDNINIVLGQIVSVNSFTRTM